MLKVHPLASGRYTDGVGPERYVPGVGWQPAHNGQDIAAPAGTPIRAAHDGYVRRKFYDRAGGNLIYLAGNGVETSYQHMIRPSPLAQGQRITAGTIVGHVGSTGASNGNHLHFEQWVGGPAWGGGRVVDPRPYLNNIGKKGKKVVTRRSFQDRRQRKIKQNQRLYLGSSKVARRDVAPKTGENLFIAHLNVKGLAEGDSIEIKFFWVNKNGKGSYSQHYKHRAVANRHGYIRENVPFTRAVPLGTFVYASIWAPKLNKKVGTIELFDVDTLNFG